MNIHNWLPVSHKSLCAGLILVAVFLFQINVADARLIFTTEGDGTIIDEDLDGDSNFSLFFGATLSEEIEFDVANDRFNISNDIRVTGNAVTTGGVDIEGAAGITFQNDETITNTVDGTLAVTATTTTTSGALSVGGNATVVGTTDLQGNVSDSLGDFTIGDNLDVTGTTSLDGNTTVETGASFTVTDGTATFGGVIDANSTSDFGGDITLSADSQILNLRAGNQTTAGAPACADATDLGRIFYDTDAEDLKYCYFDGASTYAYQSTAAVASTNVNTTFVPEFGSFAVLADGSNNIGTLEAEFDDTADHGYYKWSTRQTALNDYDLIVQWKVPEDFVSFQSNALTFTFKTATTTLGNNQIDIVGEDTAGSAITLSAAATDAVGAVADTWEDIDVTITGGTFTAGELTNFKFKVQADNTSSGITYLGPVKIKYVQSN